MWKIHQQLLDDCHYLGRFGQCHLLLHRNAVLPWFILVPETELGDLLDLDADLRRQVIEECAAVARFLKTERNIPKTNFASIGNLVPQLHLHLVGRYPGDPCWPAPVWGNLRESRSYAADELAEILSRLSAGYGLRPRDT